MTTTKALNVIFVSRFVRNVQFPSCNTCFFFHQKKTSHLKKCSKFGEKDLITGEINYEHALTSRNNENLCGQKGLYYVDIKTGSSLAARNVNADTFPFSNNSSRTS